MSGYSVIGIVGAIECTTTQRCSKTALSQTIDQIEVKNPEYTIPHGGGTGFAIPLNFSQGITEAVVLHLYCGRPLVLILGSSDFTNPGPFRMGLHGHSFFTMYPGEGITSITAINNDTTHDVSLSMAVGALGSPTDLPPYFFPPTP
jgi:hypothetical protein